GMVCVVGWMRDLILQLSKSSIYSTKPIASQLNPSYMSEDAAAVLASLNLPTGHYPVEDFPQEDWDPRENSVFLQSYQ
ncbi:hypothetical protein C4Y62_003995, partial [Klebsiella pneumoniae subsp. pneumoniae]